MTVAAVASASLFATAAAPATASAATAAALPMTAACPAIYPKPAYCSEQLPVGYSAAPAGYVGWTWLNLNYCAPGRICTLQYRTAAAAWSWTGTTWRQASLRGDQWVYLYPYSGSWRWAWTQDTGWLAVQNVRFELR